MRQTIVAGNWKMNASKETVNTLVLGILKGLPDVKNSKVIVCAPSPYLSQVEALVTHSQLNLGAQDLNVNASGAFTGEVSADMIKDFGAEYVVVGHSERRSLYGETDEIVADKVQVALDNGLTPLFCIGELLEERESNNTEAVVTRQINAVINKVGIEAFKNIIVAYEPVWAIGTGVTATPQQAQDTHAFIRRLLAENNADIAQSTPILYGGSMNPANAEELIACEDIDGGLIGGASLKAEDFLSICKAG
ncbi:MAG: Triosephosphate isomerase [Catillopecten margaritatus gill symbiont]|uniref:Triosephosphate isomerase n=1 Tax=Catillopecten margaritatus gill symbiont TaxID=3083288 RepID=A0AAU6PHW8_9GAMM